MQKDDTPICPYCDANINECDCSEYVQALRSYSWMASVVKEYPKLFDGSADAKTKEELIKQL